LAKVIDRLSARLRQRDHRIAVGDALNFSLPSASANDPHPLPMLDRAICNIAASTHHQTSAAVGPAFLVKTLGRLLLPAAVMNRGISVMLDGALAAAPTASAQASSQIISVPSNARM
jgi:hypothetical protein